MPPGWRFTKSPRGRDRAGFRAFHAEVGIEAGEPVLPSAVAEIAVPSDWWALPIPVPAQIEPGTRLRAVLAGEAVVEGIVVAPVDVGFESMAMVAFPPNDAPQVAQAAASNALVVMVAVTAGPQHSTG